MTAIVPVVCAIIEQDGRFLAAQRAAGQSNPLLWEFPGGKIKEGELPEAALARELQEELGIAVKIKKELQHNRHTYPWISIELFPFVCDIGSGTLHPHEHAALQWTNETEARARAWAEADIPVLDEYLATLRAQSSK